MSGAWIMAVRRGWPGVGQSLAKLSPGLRWMLLLTLLACLGVAWQEPATSPDASQAKPVSPTAHARAETKASGLAVTAGVELWPTSAVPTKEDDQARQPWLVLTAQSKLAWAPPPPPPPPPMPRVRAVVPAGPPPAPAFPYRMIGRLEMDGSTHAVLSNGKDSFEVAPTRVLDGNWRVEGVSDADIQMTWIPSGQKISVGFAR